VFHKVRTKPFSDSALPSVMVAVPVQTPSILSSSLPASPPAPVAVTAHRMRQTSAANSFCVAFLLGRMAGDPGKRHRVGGRRNHVINRRVPKRAAF
jgi:hypothetical protein